MREVTDKAWTKILDSRKQEIPRIWTTLAKEV